MASRAGPSAHASTTCCRQAARDGPDARRDQLHRHGRCAVANFVRLPGDALARGQRSRVARTVGRSRWLGRSGGVCIVQRSDQQQHQEVSVQPQGRVMRSSASRSRPSVGLGRTGRRGRSSRAGNSKSGSNNNNAYGANNNSRRTPSGATPASQARQCARPGRGIPASRHLTPTRGRGRPRTSRRGAQTYASQGPLSQAGHSQLSQVSGLRSATVVGRRLVTDALPGGTGSGRGPVRCAAAVQTGSVVDYQTQSDGPLSQGTARHLSQAYNSQI